jgi:hypothetical protein
MITVITGSESFWGGVKLSAALARHVEVSAEIIVRASSVAREKENRYE